MKNLKERINRYRVRKASPFTEKLSMTETAFRLGVQVNTVYRWMRGACKPSYLAQERMKREGI